jgi:hypothetical protein
MTMDNVQKVSNCIKYYQVKGIYSVVRIYMFIARNAERSYDLPNGRQFV